MENKSAAEKVKDMEMQKLISKAVEHKEVAPRRKLPLSSLSQPFFSGRNRWLGLIMCAVVSLLVAAAPWTISRRISRANDKSSLYYSASMAIDRPRGHGTENVTTTSTTLDTVNPSTFRSILNTTLPFTPSKTIYAYPSPDRSGAAITTMLVAHSYAFYRGFAFGGTCGEASKHDRANRALIQALGLSDILIYGCPEEKNAKQQIMHFHKSHIDKLGFQRFDGMTADWAAYIHRTRDRRNSSDPPPSVDGIFRIAVHTRRGDVSLCSNNAWKRYTPNVHFLPLIERALQDRVGPYEVTIFSESLQSGKVQYEDFSDFTSRNYTLHLDGDLATVWNAFMEADVLITSKSTFAVPPAVMRNGQGRVIFTPARFAKKPLLDWEVVEDELMLESEKEMLRLQEERCPLKGKETDQEDYLSNRQKYWGR